MAERQICEGRRRRASLPRGLFGLLAFLSLLVVAQFVAPSALAACTYGYCAPSSTVISHDTVKQSSSVTSDLISDRIESAFNTAAPSTTGATANSYDKRLHVWVNASQTWLHNDRSNEQYRGNLFTGVGGIDMHVTPDLLIGAMVGYQHLDLDTGFNLGRLRNDGVSVGTYGALALSRHFSIDGHIGHTWSNYAESRPGVSGRFDASRWFGNVDFKAHTTIDNWIFKSSFGYYYTHESQSGYTESDGGSVGAASAYFGQLRLKGEIGHQYDTRWGSITPWASTRLEYITNQDRPNVLDAAGATAARNRFSTTFGLGVNARYGENLTLSVRATDTETFSGVGSFGIFGSVKYRF